MADSSSTAVEYTDVIVVGARCAGSAVAMTMARAGRRVIVLDSAQFPSDTLSTHLLWPGGLAELDALGVLDQVEELGAPRLTSAFAAGAGYRVPSEFAPADGIDYAMCAPHRLGRGARRRRAHRRRRGTRALSCVGAGVGGRSLRRCAVSRSRGRRRRAAGAAGGRRRRQAQHGGPAVRRDRAVPAHAERTRVLLRVLA